MNPEPPMLWVSLTAGLLHDALQGASPKEAGLCFLNAYHIHLLLHPQGRQLRNPLLGEPVDVVADQPEGPALPNWRSPLLRPPAGGDLSCGGGGPLPLVLPHPRHHSRHLEGGLGGGGELLLAAGEAAAAADIVVAAAAARSR